MALTARRDADVFARLLEGEPPVGASPQLESLAELARALPRPDVRPDAEFVARLRADLVVAARARAATLPRQAEAPSRERLRESGRPIGRAPRTLQVRFPRRVVPAVAATLAGLAVLVGGLSSRALPGDRLYDVKLGIGQAQVRLAGSDLERGRALLRQVDHRLDEVDALVAAGDPRAAQVDVALANAITDLAQAQRVLLSTSFDGSQPEALRALADASAQAVGRLHALQPMLPTGSSAELHRLLDLLATGQSALMQQVTACGTPCADLRDDLARIAAAGGAALAGATDPRGVGSLATPGAPSAGVPSTAVTQAPGGGAVPDPGAGLPGATASVPGVAVTVPGASVTTGAGGLPSVTLPPVEATLGPLTASVSVPALSGPSASSTSPASTTTTSSCVIAVGGICIG
jgi:Domain of unknown function (DUF5667)